MGRHLFRKLIDIQASDVDRQKLLVQFLKEHRVNFRTRSVPPACFRYSVETRGLCFAASAVRAGILEQGRPVEQKLRFNGVVIVLTTGQNLHEVQSWATDPEVDVIISVYPGDVKTLYDKGKKDHHQ